MVNGPFGPVILIVGVVMVAGICGVDAQSQYGILHDIAAAWYVAALAPV